MRKVLGHSRGLSTIGVIAIIIAVLAVAGGIYWWQTNKTTPSANPSPQDQTANWQTYTNNDLGYSVKYPPTWIVDETGLTAGLNKEVKINPPDQKPFVNSISISIDSRPIETIKNVYSQNVKNATESLINFAGQTAYQYQYQAPSNTLENYIFYNGKVYLLSTDTYNLTEVKQAFSTFKFTK